MLHVLATLIVLASAPSDLDSTPASAPLDPRVATPGSLSGDDPAKPTPGLSAEDTRKPIPSAVSIASTRTALREEVLPEAYRDGGEELVQELARYSAAFEGEEVQRYVLLDELRLEAAGARELTIALGAAIQLHERYRHDPSELESQTVLLFLKKTPPVQHRAVLPQIQQVIAACLTRMDAKSAGALLEACEWQTKRSKNASLQEKAALLVAQHGACVEAVAAKAVLGKEQRNADAMSTLGRYLCLWVGDFGQGMPMLAAGSEKPLRELATLDMKGEALTCAEYVKLAQGWWAVQQELPTPSPSKAGARAGEWAAEAKECADGFAEVGLKKLMKQMEEATALEPKAIEAKTANVDAKQAQEEQETGSLGVSSADIEKWANVLDRKPSSKVVRNSAYRKAIEKTNLPWRVRHRKTGIEMLLIPIDESLERLVYIGRYEVQAHEYAHLLDGKELERELGYPAVALGWSAVQRYLQAAGDLRLPNGEEWIFACRAGTEGDRYGNLDDIAWYPGNSGKKIRRVGGKRPNDLGLFDTLGGAFEWCSDKLGRGGSWNHTVPDRVCRAGAEGFKFRSIEKPGPAVGFRVVRDVE